MAHSLHRGTRLPRAAKFFPGPPRAPGAAPTADDIDRINANASLGSYARETRIGLAITDTLAARDEVVQHNNLVARRESQAAEKRVLSSKKLKRRYEQFGRYIPGSPH